MAGGVSDGAAGNRRAPAECGQVHDGGCVGVPTEAASGAGHGFAEHVDCEHVLHDRADGGRWGAGETAAWEHGHLQPGGDCGWNLDDRLRRVWRNAGDDLGADCESDLADGRDDPLELPGDGAFPFQLWRVLRRDLAGYVPRCKGPTGGKGFSAAGTAI